MKRFNLLAACGSAVALVGSLGLAAPAQAADEPDLRVQVVRSGLVHPWALAFLPDGSLLYTQRSAKSVTLRGPDGKVTTVLSSPGRMWAGGETGLMGIERANDFATSGRFFTCHGWRSGTYQDVRVAAWRLSTTTKKVSFERNLVTGLPSTTGRHGGCALQRGDGHVLYIGTGDAATGKNPQNLGSGGGKVLRVDDRTGAGFATNPYGTSRIAMKRRIWTYGHRNVQGLTRQPGGPIWSVEHGSYRDDEVNAMVKGGNYGWNPVPRSSGDPSYNEGANSPMTDFSLPGAQRRASWSSGDPTVASSGGAFITGSQWGSLDRAMAVSMLKGEHLRFLVFDQGFKLVRQYRPKELDGTYGRLRAAEAGPGGALWVTTSNGSNDKILKITPR
ncbi:hypothetical protein ASD11_12640 [Aeromicrobium sp. Root495]|uniref:PQQ-dependent sugar dehydrogenase n=1 Tax=Aeromicrobium sp. Root495 TaxID=1736550 RepID=UPI0006F76B37|nr:PQQ-dependent sugar dehydrogenase [Aeromicrobium sp. Root495]KQY60299.1 hypothetical protein ASD11_12640 [Aeromicrobium sp. Root495]